MAIKFKTDGIYIPSFNKKLTLNKASLNKYFKIIGSAHNQMEIKNKLDQVEKQNFKFVNDADADYIIMTNRTVFDNNNSQITNCFDKFKGIDVFGKNIKSDKNAITPESSNFILLF